MPIRERDGRFQVVVEHLKHPNGRRRQRTVGTFSTRQEAEAAERQAQDTFRVGGVVYLPLNQVVDDWWYPHIDTEPLAPSTIRHYKARMERYVLPVLGHRPLANLNGRDLDRLLTGLRFSGKTDGQVRAIKAAFRRCLRDLQLAGYIEENIVAAIFTKAEVDHYKLRKFRAGERSHAV